MFVITIQSLNKIIGAANEKYQLMEYQSIFRPPIVPPNSYEHHTGGRNVL